MNYGDGNQAPDGAGVRRKLSGQNAEQRGLSRAVFPDEPDPVPFKDRQPIRLQQQAVTEGQRELRCIQNPFCHIKNSSLLPRRSEKHRSKSRLAFAFRNLQTAA